MPKIRQSRWQNIDPNPKSPPLPTVPAPALPSAHPPPTALPNLLNGTLPSPSVLNPTSQSNFGALLTPPPNLRSLLGNINSVGPSPFSLFGPTPEQRLPHPHHIPSLAGLIFPSHTQQPQNFMPTPLFAQTQQNIDLVNNFLGAAANNQQQQQNAAIMKSLNNALLDRINQQQQQQGTDNNVQPPSTNPNIALPPPPQPPSGLPIPQTAILSPSTSSFLEPLMVPPPPPPPTQNHQTTLDSPMDIEDQDDNEEASEKEITSKGDEERKERSKNVQMADELMKRALKPYFMRRRISKEEYKEIMKKGVAKLRRRHSLRAEKVEKFVAQYVQSVVSKRKTH